MSCCISSAMFLTRDLVESENTCLSESTGIKSLPVSAPERSEVFVDRQFHPNPSILESRKR